MTSVKELKELLKKKGCIGYSGMRKAELETYLESCIPGKKRKKSPKKTSPKKGLVCPPGEEVSPKSGKCVKVCKDTQVRDDKTGRCRKRKSPGPKKVVCPPGKEVSPKSGKCVKVCKDTQVRDDKTGRCRKRKPSGRKSPKKKSKTPSPKKKSKTPSPKRKRKSPRKSPKKKRKTPPPSPKRKRKTPTPSPKKKRKTLTPRKPSPLRPISIPDGYDIDELLDNIKETDDFEPVKQELLKCLGLLA